MKRDEIKTLIPEITDEQLNEVMRINGEDINKAKGDTKKLEDDLATTKKELETAKGTIKTLNTGDGSVCWMELYVILWGVSMIDS